MLPINTFGREYVAVSMRELMSSSGVPWRGWIHVVAANDGTPVTVTPTVKCTAGAAGLNLGELTP